METRHWFTKSKFCLSWQNSLCLLMSPFLTALVEEPSTRYMGTLWQNDVISSPPPWHKSVCSHDFLLPTPPLLFLPLPLFLCSTRAVAADSTLCVNMRRVNATHITCTNDGDRVCGTFRRNGTLTWPLARDDLIVFCRRVSFKSHKTWDVYQNKSVAYEDRLGEFYSN